MTKDEAIAALDAIKQCVSADSEDHHLTADRILLAYLEANGGAEVAAAWRRAEDRVTFWYA